MSEKLKENIDLFFDKGIFIPTKTLMLTGEVDEDMYHSAMVGIHSLDSMTGEITIKIMSPGGDTDIARAIYDAIAGSKNYVRIQAYGEVASAATIIMQAADHRVMSPNSKMMIHVGSEGLPTDHPRNVDVLYNEHRKDEKWIEDSYLSRIKEKKPRYTRQKLRTLLTWDKYLSPKEALEMGLIDEIGEIS